MYGTMTRHGVSNCWVWPATLTGPICTQGNDPYMSYGVTCLCTCKESACVDIVILLEIEMKPVFSIIEHDVMCK